MAESVQVEPPAGAEAGAQPSKRNVADASSGRAGLRSIALDALVPNRYQPRRSFSAESLESLVASIRSAGVIQPVLVRPLPDGAGAPEGVMWELVAGERRWRAARQAGLAEIPAIVSEATDRESAELALVENLQREDLNPIERAEALKRLRDEFGLTQAQVAERVGLDRATVANLIRLTELEPEILELLASGALGGGHGKALLALPAGDSRVEAARQAAEGGWSVRQVERLGQERAAPTPPPAPAAPPSDHLRALEKDLGDHLGAKLKIKPKRNGKAGVITIEYFDLDHFDSLMQKLGYR